MMSQAPIFIALLALTAGSNTVSGAIQFPKCRFAPRFTQKQILKDPNTFAQDLLYWEGKFHQNNVGYNTANGLTYDGTLLDPTTGLATEKHPFSAASKESLQIMLYSHAISGDPNAARFLSPESPGAAPDVAAGILETKLKTYLDFNQTHPGYGGYLPWFISNSTPIIPTSDWVNRVPALDNGELIWAVYSAIQALENSGKSSYQALATGWQKWIDYTKATGAKIFYRGDGKVCAVTDLKNQSLDVNDPSQSYKCEGNGTLNDPYEGELFTWWLYFFGGLSKKDKDALWIVKRPQLVSVDYKMGNLGPITVQEGFWFSAHEQWKVLELPYYDVSLLKRLFLNAERVRTCNSVVTQNPGMFASVNNSTDSSGQIIGYISDAGIPSISNQTMFELDVITPYSVFPVLLFDHGVGLSWWWNMVRAKKMQNPYGSTESARIDGTAVSSFVSWDSKITTVNALLGGVTKFTREKMKMDGIYFEFLSITQREYGRVFKILKGEHQSLCLPKATIPDKGLQDYTQCR